MKKETDIVEKAEDMVKDKIPKHGLSSTIKTMIIGALAILCILHLLGKIPNPFNDDDDTSGRPIGETIREISELSTLEYDYTFVGEFKKSREVDFLIVETNVPLTQKKFIASFDGTIKYGIDIKNLDEPIEDDINKTLTFAMPEVVLTSHEIHLNSFKEWYRENNLVNPIKPTDTITFEKENKIRAEKQAVKRGIIKKVQKHTTTVITQFVQTVYPKYKDYKIICNYPDQKTIKRVSSEEE